jgi:hypothetical protein
MNDIHDSPVLALLLATNVVISEEWLNWTSW